MNPAPLKAVLFDLDDTLLANDMAVFLPHYFRMLSRYAGAYVEPERFKSALLAATRAMIGNHDPHALNCDVFWHAFAPLTGLERGDAEPFFQRFYNEHFAELAPLTRAVPFARELVEACLKRGLRVAIATNPLFPQSAIDQRLAWAGLSPDEIPFALVTHYANMHATKPHVAYYREILERLDVPPEAALMIGNDVDADIIPARHAGLRTLRMMNASAVPLSRAEQAGTDASEPIASLGTVLQLISKYS